jgi:hypothetical protein
VLAPGAQHERYVPWSEFHFGVCRLQAKIGNLAATVKLSPPGRRSIFFHCEIALHASRGHKIRWQIFLGAASQLCHCAHGDAFDVQR